MRKLETPNWIRDGFTANVVLMASMFTNRGDICISFTTHTGARMYIRPTWCPSVRRLCKLIADAHLFDKAFVSPALFELGYSADLRPTE